MFYNQKLKKLKVKLDLVLAKLKYLLTLLLLFFNFSSLIKFL